jgi:hypothetical protein
MIKTLKIIEFCINVGIKSDYFTTYEEAKNYFNKLTSKEREISEFFSKEWIHPLGTSNWHIGKIDMFSIMSKHKIK